MKRHTLLLSLPAFAVLLSPAAADEVVYSDEFKGLEGFFSTNVSGSYEDSYETRMLEAHTYLGGEISNGDLVLTVREDDKTKGVDGKPGVLVYSFDEVPSAAGHSGFIYHGRQQEPIEIPLKGKVTDETLKRIHISFQYKATNKKKEHVGMTLDCRFELDADDAYETRVEFPELKCTGEWQKFETTLDKGSNTEAFLKAVNAASYRAYKIVWSQKDEIKNYQDGDSLLIDNIKISVAK